LTTVLQKLKLKEEGIYVSLKLLGVLWKGLQKKGKATMSAASGPAGVKCRGFPGGVGFLYAVIKANGRGRGEFRVVKEEK